MNKRDGVVAEPPEGAAFVLAQGVTLGLRLNRRAIPSSAMPSGMALGAPGETIHRVLVLPRVAPWANTNATPCRGFSSGVSSADRRQTAMPCGVASYARN